MPIYSQRRGDFQNSPSAGITIKMMGGLGNQLFQFASALGVAERLKAPLILDLSAYSQKIRRNHGVDLRRFGLETIAHKLKLINGEFAPIRTNVNQSLDFLLTRSGSLPSWLLPGNTFVEKGIGYDSRIESVSSKTRLIGYFIARRYFSNVEDEIRDRLSRNFIHTTWGKEIMRESQKCGPTIIHVRRGDHLTVHSDKLFLSADYYREAISALSIEGYSGPIWLMAEDCSEAAHWLGNAFPIDRFIDAPKNSHPAESLKILSSGSALVTTESTFSWWAAFMSESRNARVVAPRGAWGRCNEQGDSKLVNPDWLIV
jgi:hypothetical protein